MYVSGLKLGLTSGDLRRMPYRTLTYMLQAWNEANTPSDKKDKGGEIIEATQAHIDSILGKEGHRMANTYKGLTIRIGADTSELNKALQASNSAISATQKQLRQLAQAAKLDPNNIKLFERRMDVLADKAQAFSNKLHELSNSPFMANLSNDTQDAALKAKLATQEYAKLCDQIKKLKNDVAIAAGKDPFKKGDDPFKSIPEGSKAAQQEIRRLYKQAGKSQTEANQKVKEYLELVERWKIANDNNVFASLNRDIDEFKTDLTATTSMVKSLYAELAREIALNPKITKTASYEKFRNAMDRAEASAKELRTQMSALDKALDLDPYNVEAARLKFAAMNEQVNLCIHEVNLLDKQLDAMKAKGLDEVSAKYTDLRQEITKAEAAVAKWTSKLDAAKASLLKMEADTSIDKLSKEFKDAQAEVKKLEAKVKSATNRLHKLAGALQFRDLQVSLAGVRSELSNTVDTMTHLDDTAHITRARMQQLGWSLYSTLTPAFMMFGHYAIQAAEDVDAAYRNMRKTVEGTEEQFEDLKQAAIDYSRTHVTSADTLLEIEAMGGQLGVATDKLEGFATTVSNLEIATNLDAETASEQLGQLSAILNDMTEDDFDNFGDALVRLGNNNATLEDKIMDVMLRIASMGTITGFSATELLSWSTAVAATGQGAEAAGTAISKTMSDIEAAVGAGGDKLEAFANVADVSSTRFAKMWNETPSDAMEAFVDGLNGIEASGGSADATLTDLGITSVRQKQTILGLMQTVDDLNANLEMSENAWNGVGDGWGDAGDAAREAQRKAEGFSGAIQLLRNNVDALGVEMGDALTPTITTLTDFVAAATQAYSDLPDIAKWAIDMGVIAGAFAGPALVGFNAVRGALNDVGEGLVDGKKAMAKMGEEGAKVIASNETISAALGMTGVELDKTGMKWGDMSKKQQAAALGAHALKKAYAALPAVLGVVAASMIIDDLVKYIEYTRMVEDATNGMVEAAMNAKTGFAQVDASAYVDSAEEVVEAAKEVIEANADLANELTDTWADINKDARLVDEYVNTIEDLAGKSSLSATDQVRLKAAVQGLNDTCGTTYQVVDAANGKLDESTDAIRENTQAWQENARQQAAYQALIKVQAQILETETQLALTNDKMAESAKGVGLYIGDFAVAATPAAVAFHNLESGASDLQMSLDDLRFAEQYYIELMGSYASETENAAASTSLYTEEVEALIEGLSGLTEDNALFNEMLADSGMTIEEVAVQMDAAGISIDSLSSKMEEYASKTADAFNRIETVSDVSLQSMLETLEYNTETTRNWSSNIAKLYEKAGSDSERAFIDYIAGMGVEYAPIVQQLLDDSDGMLEELAAAWQEADSVGGEAAFAETQRAAEEAAAKIEESAKKSVDAYALLREGVDYEIENTDFNTPMAEKAEGIAEGILEQKEPAVQAITEVKDATVQVLDGIENETVEYGYDFATGYAQGVRNGQTVVNAAVDDMVVEALKRIPKEQDSSSPAKKTMPFGRDFVDGYVVGIEDETPEAVSAASEMVDDTLDMLATSESGAWTHGYHAAINYAEGLSSGAGAVKDAASGVADAANDEMDAFLNDLASKYKQAQLVAKEGSTLLTEIMWGSFYPATMKYDYSTPKTEDVYASMKVLEAAGYDLDEYIEKHAELSEKMKSGDVSDSVKEEYEKIMALSSQLSASADKMKDWHGLYVVKDDLITGMETAEDWSDSLTSLFSKTGVVYSQEFVEAMMDGGEEYQSALRKMAGMTSSQVQEMVDSFDDLALAQREQEINARSLWVNSLPNATVNAKEAMLDFRDTCLDVKEAIYSNKGLSHAFELAGMQVVDFALDLESLDVTMADFASMAQSYASQVANGFSAMTTYNQTGLAEWERNLKANIVSSQQWADDVNAVFASIDPSIDSEAFRQAVLNEGFDVWGQVMADMAAMPPERINEYVALYNEALTTGMLSAYETIDAIAPGDELLAATIEGIAGLTPELESQAKSAAMKGAGAALATQPEWYSTGQSLAGGIASGIQSQIGAIAAAAAATVRAAIAAAKAEAQINSPSRLSHDEIGVMWGLGVSTGIDDSEREVRAASVKVINAAMDAAKRTMQLNGVSAQVAAANGFAASTRAANVVNTTNNNKTVSAPVTVSIQATIREEQDITKLAREINKIQNRALRAGGNA